MHDVIRLAIVDDHPLFREGVVAAIGMHEDIEIVGQGVSADEAVELCEKQVPDILLLDMSMPGDPLAATRQILRKWPRVKIAFLTASEDPDNMARALEAGASGYILKGVSALDLITVIFSIRKGQTYVAPELAARLLTQVYGQNTAEKRDKPVYLSPREEQILKLVSEGKTNKETARLLDISEKTVKHYMTNIMQKLNVRNRVEAVLAVRLRADAHPKQNGQPGL